MNRNAGIVGGMRRSPSSRRERIQRRIAAARKEIDSDLVLKAGNVVNVFTGEILTADVAVCDGAIVGVGPEYNGLHEEDTSGKWILPGLLDGHFHVESSMMTPFHLAEALLVHGTTAIVGDPHEIANVMGLAGVEFMIRDSTDIPFDMFFMAPSCVPATALETSGATLGARQLRTLKGEHRILGLAEMMNFPGVLAGDPEVIRKILLFEDKVLDGHCPGLSGCGLQAYMSAGIGSDHETTRLPEALEKLRGGMMLMIREGTSARNLEALIPVVDPRNSRRCCLVCDDLHPGDIAARGHLDFLVKKAVKSGLDPITAIQMVTVNPADYFGMKDRGAVAPGRRADLVVLSDLDAFDITAVYKDGVPIVRDGTLVGFPQRKNIPSARKTAPLAVGALTVDDLAIAHPGGRVRVIEMIPGQVLTRLGWATLPAVSGRLVSDPGSDILKLVVVERHTASGRIGKGALKGLGLRRGAIASSVAHDSHNIIAAGVSDTDIFKAVSLVTDMGGGLAVAADGEGLAAAPLPIGGLMSSEPLQTLLRQLAAVNAAARDLGSRLDEPFMALSFMALPVIPEIKLTDRGLVDVRDLTLVPLFEGM